MMQGPALEGQGPVNEDNKEGRILFALSTIMYLIGIWHLGLELPPSKEATLNCAFRWTHTNFSTFHTIQILTEIVKKLMSTFHCYAAFNY